MDVRHLQQVVVLAKATLMGSIFLDSGKESPDCHPGSERERCSAEMETLMRL